MNSRKFNIWMILSILIIGFWLTDTHQPFKEYPQKKKKSSTPTKKSIVVNGHKYDGPEKYIYYHQAIRTGQTDIENIDQSKFYKHGYQQKAFQKALIAMNNNRSNRRTKALSFEERGPVNVPGRTRALVVDPSDDTGNTWFAGSVSGGIWKTENAGELWIKLGSDLPNLAFTTMDMPASNPNVIYAGTGEGSYGGIGSVNGNGIFKTIDGGTTWEQLPSTDNEEFINVSRVIVNPDNEDEVLACTTNYSFRNASSRRSFIFKSTNGGATWEKVFTSTTGNDVQHLVATPDNFSVIYATVNGIGVFKSTNSGLSWEKKSTGLVVSDLNNSTGLLNGDAFGRLELAVAPNNTDIVYISVEGTASETNSDLYVSFDAAESWNLVIEENGSDNPDWLRSQGWYDNTIAVHPFKDSIVYVGGVDTWRLNLLSAKDTITRQVLDFNLNNIESFANIVNVFSDEGEELEDEDLIDIEIRFGSGLSQKAHRFTVPTGSTSGVPKEDYSYQDYVDVPFEVWDTENNIQLMASFRDNLEDGAFSLTNNSNTSREYIYVHAIPYAETTNSNIAQTGGHLFKSLHLVWLNSLVGVTWNPNNLPNASIQLDINDIDLVTWERSSKNIADVYNDYEGLNTNVHPDQHNLIITKGEGENFRILNANDGGIYLTTFDTDPGVSDDTWSLAGITYNTSQFYGADKMPGEDRYIGGTQDNGTWLSVNTSDDATATYRRVIGGDGFESVWHYQDPDKIIGSSQFNFFARSLNGGQTFSPAVSGLEDDGPFVSRLANSKSDPDKLFTVGGSGVYRSDNFGESWESIPIVTRWGFWSGSDIEISLANPQFVWAGGGMTGVRSIHLSTDGGNTFNPTNNYADEIGVTTGIYTHPFEDSTAYVLFSVNERAKILRTTDLGNTWSDISGFADESSSSGFPNVAVYSLLVMPYDTDIIWAGTEIGIVESLDNGQTWQLLDSNFPAVSVWDLKVVDDQVVIATHGRGIWTVTIPELEDAWKPENVVLAPLLFSAAQAVGISSINLDVELRSLYDSVQVIANDAVLFSLEEDLEIGRGTISISNLTSGLQTFRVIGFKNGKAFPSDTFDLNIAPFLTPATSYSTDFNTGNSDFDLDRFSISRQSGFDDSNLHTSHPYPAADDENQAELNLTASLKIPIIVAETNALIKYKDVAIVEIGEENTTFGDSEFWDFVIVEGTKDGFNWLPLAVGYDASFNNAWTTRYEAEGDGDKELFVEHEIDLLETFTAGDTIQIRFRLYSDPFAAGWGWAIDDLSIQTDTEVTGINDPAIADKVTLYPNPSNGIFTLEINNTLKGKLELQIFNQLGREIDKELLNNQNGFRRLDIDLSQKPKGMYILQLSDGNNKVTKKLIVE